MDAQWPRELYEANVQLQLDTVQLQQEGAQQWLGAVQRLGTATVNNLKSQLDSGRQRSARDTTDHPAPRLLWHALDGRFGNAYALQEIGFRTQLMLAFGMKQAVLDWQERVLDAVAERNEAVATTSGQLRAARGVASPARAANE